MPSCPAVALPCRLLRDLVSYIRSRVQVLVGTNQHCMGEDMEDDGWGKREFYRTVTVSG